MPIHAMERDYDLRIGTTEVIEPQLAAELSSEDNSRRKKAQNILSERLKETRVRVGTILKTDNVSFLLGAGASMKAGGVGLAAIPPELEKKLHEKVQLAGEMLDPEWLSLFYATCSEIAGQTFTLSERREALNGDLTALARIPINLEDYIGHLHMWRSGMASFGTKTELTLSAETKLELSKDALNSLILEINRCLSSLVELPVARKKGALDSHRRFIRKILTRPLNLRRANLFTLNYDTLIEQAADAEGAVLLDGSVGTLRRIFRPESYDLVFYFPAQTTEGRVHRFDRVLHLYKLHGSINWHRCSPDWENPYGLYAALSGQ